MLLFVVGPFFRKRKRQRRSANDALPTQPLIDVLLFWTVLMSGALLGAAAVSVLAAIMLFDTPLDGLTITLAIVAGAAAPICFAISIKHLWKLTRDHPERNPPTEQAAGNRGGT